MTEVRTSKSGHLGLFALKDFSVGDVLLEELPVVTLAPSDEKSSQELLSEWNDGTLKQSTDDAIGGKLKKNDGSGDDKTLWTSIKPPPSDAELVPDYLHGTFKGMVQAGIVFIKKYQGVIEQNELESLLQLYHPTKESISETEKSILNVADEAILYLQQHVTTTKTTAKIFSDFNEWDKLQKILLIWSCNSFQGGRVYPQLSRVNHSCNPNTVIQTTNAGQNNGNDNNNEGQKLLAATKIEKGSEICISYLGLILYTDTFVRQKKLKRTKFFECECSRCTAASFDCGEGAARIPCPACHPRDAQQMSLDEEAQYDDDQTVKYANLMEPKINKIVCCGKCETGTGTGLDNDKLCKVLRSVCRKMEVFLDTYENGNNNDNEDDEDEDEKDAILEEHASLASTMMGDRHWTSNLTLLLHLDRRLKAMSQRMMVTQELPEEDEIAEAIDTLQRISRFVDSLKLDMDPGHLLGDVTIGTARMLISLGDEKSQKYGAEWLSKIEDYVDQFANDGLQKVVSVLKVAWKKQQHGRSNADDDDNSDRKRKKQK